MAKVIIGGESFTVPELNFMALERAWPYVEDAMLTTGYDPMKGPLAALRIIGAGIMEDENFQPDKYKVTAGPDDPDAVHDQVILYLRKKLKAKEIVNLAPCIQDIIEEAGLAAKEGEENPVEEKANLSPEIAPGS